MSGSTKRSHDYRLLVEDDLKDEFGEDASQSSSSTASLTSLRLPWHVFKIPFRHAIRAVIALPLGAFVFAVLWGLYTDYDRAVNVLCTRRNNEKIRNYLPSLSAAIGDFAVSQVVWTICIVVHAPPRLLFGSMYLKYFETIVPASHIKWAYTAWILSILELLGLVGLSIVTSRRNLPTHAFCFSTFLIASELYMLFQCFLQSSRQKSQGQTSLEAKSLRVKKFLTRTVIVSTVILFLVYFRHETQCEEGVYTIFALIEYIIILSNMGFHACAYWDFYDRVIVLDLCRPFMAANTNKLAWNI